MFKSLVLRGVFGNKVDCLNSLKALQAATQKVLNYCFCGHFVFVCEVSLLFLSPGGNGKVDLQHVHEAVQVLSDAWNLLILILLARPSMELFDMMAKKQKMGQIDILKKNSRKCFGNKRRQTMSD